MLNSQNPVNIIYHINGLKEENLMAISMDAEKAFDKIWLHWTKWINNFLKITFAKLEIP